MGCIVHVITRFVNGGADENTLITCNHQAKAGHDVWLVHGRDHTGRMISLLDPAVHVVNLPSLLREISPVNDLKATLALARLYLRLKPDVVHTHTSKAGIVGRLAALITPRARVVHGVHILPFTGESPLRKLIYLVLEKLAALWTHAFIDVSEGMRDLCLAHGLGSAQNHHVIRSGMDVERFRSALPADDIEAAKAALPGDVTTLVYVAVLERRKRHQELIEAMAPLLQADARLLLLLAGEGPERGSLEAQIARHGLTGRIRILGFREDVERVLAGSDICLFASQREGLPRSVVQYVISGKPVVALELPGIGSVVKNGVNGIVVAENDFAAFAGALRNLCTDAELRLKFAEASRRMDLSAWDGRVMTDCIQHVYNGLNVKPPHSLAAQS